MIIKRVAVYGSAVEANDPIVRGNAGLIGQYIAVRNWQLITGACTGYPYDAVLGAKKNRGHVIGFSPAYDRTEHVEKFRYPTEGFTRIFYVDGEMAEHLGMDEIARKNFRNLQTANCADSAIIIGGENGTMNEFTNMFAMGKPIGVLEGSGGISDNVIHSYLGNVSNPKKTPVIFDSEPNKLVERVLGTKT